MSDKWFAELVEDDSDPNTPAFWETLAWASRQGMDLKAPEVTLPDPSLGVLALELQRQVALKTPTMAMPVLEPVATVD